MPHQNPSDDELRRIYQTATTIAVVGASASPDKPSHKIPKLLHDNGYRILPVNPKAHTLFGSPVYRTLLDVPRPLDVVDVFRPAEETPDIARDAVRIGAKVLWLQKGIHDDEAVRIAKDAGLTVVTDLCMGETFKRLGLPPRR